MHILPFQRFAQSLRADYDVVKAGVPLAVSNGQIEGQNNRLKMLKRQIRRCMDEMGLIYLGSIELQPPWLDAIASIQTTTRFSRESTVEPLL